MRARFFARPRILVRMLFFGRPSEKSFPPVMHRTSEGGVEFVSGYQVQNGWSQLREMVEQQGGALVAADHRAEQTLWNFDLPSTCLFLLGHEALGLSKNARRSAQQHVKIPGAGHVESLNVSAAAAAFFSEFRRRFVI